MQTSHLPITRYYIRTTVVLPPCRRLERTNMPMQQGDTRNSEKRVLRSTRVRVRRLRGTSCACCKKTSMMKSAASYLHPPCFGPRTKRATRRCTKRCYMIDYAVVDTCSSYVRKRWVYAFHQSSTLSLFTMARTKQRIQTYSV